MTDNTDKRLTGLLKGKVIEKIETSAFPDVFIHFEDGDIMHCEFEYNAQNIENGDEQILNIDINDLREKRKRTYRVTSNDYWD